MKKPQNDRVPDVQEEGISGAVVAAPAGPDAQGWLDMNEAPRDGTLIEYDDGKYARFRTTRRRQDGRWAVVGFWCDAFTATEIEATHWRMPVGFRMPGLVL